MKALAIIPTYNEKENIAEMIRTIRAEVHRPIDILVVDSASPDGTANQVRTIQEQDRGLFLLEQSAKLGLGKAYTDGMKWALDHQSDYRCIITMDADFSHHPRYLDTLIADSESFELVIGSRYTTGGQLMNWPQSRQFLSRFANWYARTITGLPFCDLTSGFHCFQTGLLKRILRYDIHTEGYAFLVELKFLSILQKARYKEIPIIFSDRTRGDSKISKRVILESIFFVLSRMPQRSRIKRILSQISNLKKEEALSVSL